MAMQNIQKFFYVAAACLALSLSPTAFAQDYDEPEMTQKEAESYAKMIFRQDIKAGKLTVQKAGAFFKCGNERYAKKLRPELASELSDATEDLIEHSDKGTQLSAAKKERYGRAYKEAFKLQKEAEDSCRKELGIDPSVQSLFQSPGSKQK